MTENKKIAEEETPEERRKRYLKERAERQKELRRKLKKYQNMPRFLLVRKVKSKWSKLSKLFEDSHAKHIVPQWLSNITLRSLLAVGHPPRVID